MPEVLVTRPNAKQNSLFLPQRWSKLSPLLILLTHGGMARLSWHGWLVTCRGGLPAWRWLPIPLLTRLSVE